LNNSILLQHQKAPPLEVGMPVRIGYAEGVAGGSGSFQGFRCGVSASGSKEAPAFRPGRLHLKNKPKGAIFKSSSDY